MKKIIISVVTITLILCSCINKGKSINIFFKNMDGTITSFKINIADTAGLKKEEDMVLEFAPINETDELGYWRLSHESFPNWRGNDTVIVKYHPYQLKGEWAYKYRRAELLRFGN